MQGTCLCGTVRFRIDGTLPKLYRCHCSLCRKQGGAASNAAMIVEAGNFSWIAGQARISSYAKPTGFRSDFCAQCGSPVPNPLRKTDYWWVPAGLLEDGAPLEVAADLFVGSKAAWDTIPPGARQFETIPALAELIALLHARR